MKSHKNGFLIIFDLLTFSKSELISNKSFPNLTPNTSIVSIQHYLKTEMFVRKFEVVRSPNKRSFDKKKKVPDKLFQPSSDVTRVKFRDTLYKANIKFIVP